LTNARVEGKTTPKTAVGATKRLEWGNPCFSLPVYVGDAQKKKMNEKKLRVEWKRTHSCE